MGKLKVINSLHSLHGKTVVLRVDSDVEIDRNLPAGRQVVDDTRLAASIDTIELILKLGGEINIIGHLGRPEGQDEKYTMYPIAKWFAHQFKGEVQPIEIGKLKAWKINDKINLIE